MRRKPMPHSSTQLDGARPPRLPKSAPKVRLSIVAGPGAGGSLDLTRCVSIIGSRSGCKLQLKSPEVSAVHCAIVNTGEEVFVRDLASRNGTYLNDLPAILERLEDGDTLRVGDWELRVEVSAYTLDTLSDLPHVSLEPEPTAIGAELNGSGELVKLQRPVGVLGRRAGCDIVVNSKQVSRVHLMLFIYAGHPVFCDLLSNNGVRLQGVRLGFGKLHSGDVLSLGGYKVRMILPGVSRRPAAPSAGGDTTSGTGTDAVTRTSAGSGSGSGSGTVAAEALEGSDGDGTVVPVTDDQGDRIDIRTAEMDGR